MNIVKFLTDNKDNNMQENMEIVFEILEKKDKIMESYCDAIIKKHKEQIKSKDFEIFINKKWRLGMDYKLVIRPKEHNKVYIAFCVRENFMVLNYFALIMKRNTTIAQTIKSITLRLLTK